MKARIFMALALLVGMQTEAPAQLSTLTLRDGSVMRGYIAVQLPGEYIAFKTVDAEVYIDNTDELTVEERFVPKEALPDGWRKWAVTEGQLQTEDGSEGLRLCTLRGDFGVHRNAMIKERGMTIKYEQHAEDIYALSWTGILKISRDDTDMASQSLYDQITMDNGNSYTGIIVEQNPGVSTKIKLRNGEVRVLEQSSIKCSRKIAKSMDIDLWEARPSTNTILLVDGTQHTGVIVCQYVGDDAYDSYVELYKPDGTQERINFIDIEEYHNEPRNITE